MLIESGGWYIWYGNLSYGSRYILDILPIAAILFILGWVAIFNLLEHY